MTTYTRYSSDFISWTNPSRLDRLNVRSMGEHRIKDVPSLPILILLACFTENYTIGCEPTMLVTGATYQTLVSIPSHGAIQLSDNKI